jgi:uncharacterized protein YoxC
MSPSLETSIIFLIFTTIIICIVTAVFFIKLLIDLSKLTLNIDEVTSLVKKEIEPTLNEIKEALNNINTLAKSADKQVDTVKKILTGVIGASGVALGGIKTISGGFLKGILAGLKLFRKK